MPKLLPPMDPGVCGHELHTVTRMMTVLEITHQAWAAIVAKPEHVFLRAGRLGLRDSAGFHPQQAQNVLGRPQREAVNDGEPGLIVSPATHQFADCVRPQTR